jgi:hypothetical protein
MGLFGFGRKDKVIDLTEGYKRQVARAEQIKQAQKDSSASSGADGFSFFDSPATMGSPDDADSSETPEERKKRLAKRIMDMTEKLEDTSNQIYHLQQRVEVLERKLDIRRT